MTEHRTIYTKTEWDVQRKYVQMTMIRTRNRNSSNWFKWKCVNPIHNIQNVNHNKIICFCRNNHLLGLKWPHTFPTLVLRYKCISHRNDIWMSYLNDQTILKSSLARLVLVSELRIANKFVCGSPFAMFICCKDLINER